MRKLLKIIGIGGILCISFIYSEKTVSVVKEYDEIMIQIRKEENKYRIDPIEPIIKNNTIIPGLSGERININKTYNNMRRYGKYDSSLIILKKILPKNKLEKNKNKYIISGNKNKRMVSFIFIVEEYDNIDNIVKILDKKSVKGNFFVDGYWLEKNSNIIDDLIKKDHIIGNLSYNRDYLDDSFNWMEVVIEKISKQKIGYCYTEKENKDIIDTCKNNDNYTVIPSVVIDKKPYINIKNNLDSGYIIAFKITNELEKELPSIISYIKGRGYSIANLNNHFSE